MARPLFGRFLAVLAAAALLNIATVGRTDAHGVCRKVVSAAGEQRMVLFARRAARAAWRKKVMRLRGPDWARWQRARGARYRCKHVGGTFDSVCVARARPCRHR